MKQGKPTFEQLSEGDAPAYRALWLHALEESPRSFSDHVLDAVDLSEAHFRREYLAGTDAIPEKITIGCRDGDRLVGIVSLVRDDRRNGRHKGILKNLYVHDEYRGRGIGASLVRRLLAEADHLPGFSQVYLWALDAPLLAFYASFGFERQGPAVERDLCINGQWVSAYYMVRQ